MLFASLGKTPTNSGWNYVLAFYIFLAAIATTAYLAHILKRYSHLLQLFSSLLSGALLGFYYGGVATNNNPQFAAASAVFLSFIFAFAHWRKYSYLSVVVKIIATISAYGFAYFLGTQTIYLLSVNSIISGALWSIFCVTYLFIATNITIAEFLKHKSNR